jgi:hypothetical protein
MVNSDFLAIACPGKLLQPTDGIDRPLIGALSVEL